MHYEFSPHVFPTDRTKIAFMISHLVGRARAWATAEWARESPLPTNLTMSKESISVEATSSNLTEKKLQVCVCGWQKVTTLRGLRIHQGKMKCLVEGT